MVKFYGKVWKAGNSAVVSVPKQILGAEVQYGDEVLIELRLRLEDAFSWFLSGDLQGVPA